MSGIFKFKQFEVDQSGCAMKINTDGVLLGALVHTDDPQSILDIGTGTGVIAMMLAQRYTSACIDAVEIDKQAAQTAGMNFANSPFKERLAVHAMSIDMFLDVHLDQQFDLIVSNPPFHINSLESPEPNKALAKHSEVSFFEMLMKDVSEYLSREGLCWLILPPQTAIEVKELATINRLKLQRTILVKSFEKSVPHREILCFGFQDQPLLLEEVVIYKAARVYSEEYIKLLQPYFITF